MGHVQKKRAVKYISDYLILDVSFSRVPTDIMLLIPCWGINARSCHIIMKRLF